MSTGQGVVQRSWHLLVSRVSEDPICSRRLDRLSSAEMSLEVCVTLDETRYLICSLRSNCIGEGRGWQPRHCGTGAQVYGVHLLSSKSWVQQLPEMPALRATQAHRECLVKILAGFKAMPQCFLPERIQKGSQASKIFLYLLGSYALSKSCLGQWTVSNAISLKFMPVLRQCFPNLSIYQKHLKDSSTDFWAPPSKLLAY